MALKPRAPRAAAAHRGPRDRSNGQLGGNYPGGGLFSFSYDGEILSSIHINGISAFDGSAA